MQLLALFGKQQLQTSKRIKEKEEGGETEVKKEFNLYFYEVDELLL